MSGNFGSDRQAPLRVLLADDHLVLRQGLKVLLERQGIEVVAEASDGHTAVELARKLAPDVAVLDVAMPGLNGVAAAREITQAAAPPRVILLTALEDARFVADALRVGVRGFVLKAQGAADLIQAIQEVYRGGLYVSPGVSQAVIDACNAAAGTPIPDRLSERERQVVQLVAQGKATKEIATLLKISVKTVEFHRSRIMTKLNIHDTAGLVRYAIREGLITP